MAGINKIMIIGNLGRDPEMRYLPSGVPVTSFSVAVSRRFAGQDGEQREETDWFNVECWNKLAEIANQYLSKGKQVFIEGRVSLHTWDDRQTGEKRSSMRVRALELQMLGSRGDSGDAAGYSSSGDSSAGSTSTESPEFDNMPF